MRVSSVQNNSGFKALQVRNHGDFYYKASEVTKCKEKLAKTKFIDVIIDSHGLAIRDKKTDIIQKFQSFSLFPKENSVSVNMVGEENPKYKFSYPNLSTAKEEWNKLREVAKNYTHLDLYTMIALWLEDKLSISKEETLQNKMCKLM